MRVFDETTPNNIEHRELQLRVLTCSAIAVLGAGVAVLMYPAIFLGAGASDRLPRIAVFVGFCVLCVLFAAYVWERHEIIRHLRHQLDASRKLVANVQADAGLELLNALPNFELFQDCLAMEVRRAVATLNELSVVVITITMSPELNPSEKTRLFSSIAKSLSATLQQGESIYVLAPTTCFGIVMPNVGLGAAIRTSDWIADGLAKIAGAGSHMTYWMNVANYPTHASNASELFRVVQKLVPEDTWSNCKGETDNVCQSK